MFCCSLILVDFIHILQGYFTGTGAIIWLPQCQWSNLEEYGWMNHGNPLRAVVVITTKQSTTKPHGWFVRYNVWHPCWGHGMERFPHHWPFVRRIHWSLVDEVHVHSGHKCFPHYFPLWGESTGHWWMKFMFIQVINVFHTTSLCEGNPLVTGGFLSQRASKEEFWFFLCYQPD